jgi:hypothetical protein
MVTTTPTMAVQAAPMVSRAHSLPIFRKPRRLSITIPDHVYCYLLERADQEGRSLSSLASFLLEKSLHEVKH